MYVMSQAKAESYARYRLAYSDEAVQMVLARTGAERVVDLGAGTGLLTRHFAGRVKTLHAVEPEPEMRRIAARELHKLQAGQTEIHVLDGVAEATGLPDHSADLLVAANAHHRFHPERAIAEMGRILKPGGWLALFTYGDDGHFLQDTLRTGCIPEHRQRLASTRHELPASYFYGDEEPEELSFPRHHAEGWEEYWGSVISGMEAPEAGESWFTEFESAHRKRFERLAVKNLLEFRYSTHVWLGQPKYSQ